MLDQSSPRELPRTTGCALVPGWSGLEPLRSQSPEFRSFRSIRRLLNAPTPVSWLPISRTQPVSQEKDRRPPALRQGRLERLVRRSEHARREQRYLSRRTCPGSILRPNALLSIGHIRPGPSRRCAADRSILACPTVARSEFVVRYCRASTGARTLLRQRLPNKNLPDKSGIFIDSQIPSTLDTYPTVTQQPHTLPTGHEKAANTTPSGQHDLANPGEVPGDRLVEWILHVVPVTTPPMPGCDEVNPPGTSVEFRNRRTQHLSVPNDAYASRPPTLRIPKRPPEQARCLILPP